MDLYLPWIFFAPHLKVHVYCATIHACFSWSEEEDDNCDEQEGRDAVVASTGDHLWNRANELAADPLVAQHVVRHTCRLVFQ